MYRTFARIGTIRKMDLRSLSSFSFTSTHQHHHHRRHRHRHHHHHHHHRHRHDHIIIISLSFLFWLLASSIHSVNNCLKSQNVDKNPERIRRNCRNWSADHSRVLHFSRCAVGHSTIITSTPLIIPPSTLFSVEHRIIHYFLLNSFCKPIPLQQ